VSKITDEITDENKGEKHAMVCLFGRGIYPLAIQYVKNLARQSAMPYRFLGDLTHIQDPSKSLSTASLLPMTGNEGGDVVHKVYLFHGGINNGMHVVNVQHGHLEEVPTSALLRTMQAPVSQSLSQAGTEKKYKNIDYHFSCHSAKLRNEFSADEAFWKSTISLIFSSKKATSIEQMGTALDAALRYARFCNAPGSQSTLDQFTLFLHAGMRRGDCLTMLGGELKAPLIWHAPKNQDDLLFQNLLRNVRGHELDYEKLRQAALALTQTQAQLSLLPHPYYQLRDMFFTRIGRDDVDSVTQILQRDIHLKNEKSALGMPALIWAIVVKARRCTASLLAAGADVNAIDEYGCTPLIKALATDDPKLVRRLLEAGANPDARDFDGNSPLMFAASQGWLEQVQTLIQFHAKADVWNKNQTALSMAVEQSDYDIVDACSWPVRMSGVP